MTVPIRSFESQPRILVELITPGKAREYLTFNTHNRTARSSVVQAYATDMRSGNWRWTGDPIKFAQDGTLIDGQHRLAAIAESGASIRLAVVRGLPPEAQENVDTHVKRTFSDVLRLRGEKHAVTLAATCRSVAEWERSNQLGADNRPTTTAQLSAVLEAYPWLRESSSVVDRLRNGANLPGRVGGLAYWLFTTIDAEDAEYFFDRVASQEGHQNGDPAFELRKVLASTQTVRGTRSTRFMAAVTIKAWNKYRDGESIGQLKFRAGGARPEDFPQPK